MAENKVEKKSSRSFGSGVKSFLKFCKKNPSFTIGFIIMLIIAFVAIFAESLAPNDPYLQNPKISLMAPFVDAQYPLGTDNLGRCMLSRMMYGLRISFEICISAVALAVLFGICVGIISGMGYPGPVDSVLMRLVDMQMGFPFIVLVIILISLLGCTVPSIICVLALSYWAPYARNIRGSTMIEKNMDYISAARLMGAGNGRIALRYLGRNVFPSILPMVPMDLSAAIVTESLLSYMGLGVQPPQISLGTIMGDGKNYIATHWWITAMSGFLIVIMAVALTLIGDALHKHFSKLD